MSFLSVQDVRFSYPAAAGVMPAEVLKGISCDFELGRMYAVIGKSGSGKSTLLSLIAGLDRPKKGDIYYDGVSTAKVNLTSYRRDLVAVIYQSFRLFPLMTALENVRYPMELRGLGAKESKRRAAECLERVGLSPDTGRRFPTMLSGGEQQRVAIARALATEARLILADEPTGNLDSANGDKIVDLLHSLAHEGGYCVVIVTHDMKMLDKADKVFAMSDGELSVMEA